MYKLSEGVISTFDMPAMRIAFCEYSGDGVIVTCTITSMRKFIIILFIGKQIYSNKYFEHDFSLRDNNLIYFTSFHHSLFVN